MVFESVVADLLNRFLGTYIDNLNASQLNIGIWGGDVKLNQLEVKETALDELDLPVKLKFGYVQSLVLKIPWKNLYQEPTIVDVSELYLIIVPNQGLVYNEEKARKNENSAKTKKLDRLEENRRNKQKPKDGQADDSFTEKLVAQVIKNLQVRIKRVHVRYEDKFSNRDRPFATGLTMDSLDFQTTDENFKLIIQRETVKIFYKLVSLNHLSLYSNANSSMISDLTDKSAIIEALRSTISTDEKRPEGYKFMLEPMSINAKLKLNQKPEADGSDWKIPKIDLAMELDKLALAINKFQYQDMLLFLEAQERFNLSEKYIKYRPQLTQYKQHYKEWWHFAYKCILHEQVKRRRNNWSWTRIQRHRKLVKAYQEAWIHSRTEKNPEAALKKLISSIEEELDVFNINIARQQAEFEIDRRQGLVRVEDQEQQTWVGWAKSWFGGGGKKEEEKGAEADMDDAKIIEKLEQAVTPAEKEKLFEAIDYQENTPPTENPKHFVENRFVLNFKNVVVGLEDVLEMRFCDISAQVDQRPSANSIRFTSTIKSVDMRSGEQEMLVMMDANRDWLHMAVETNPLEGTFDQCVSLGIAPVMLKYHAPAVNRALDVFKPPESVRLHQLTALAIARYEEVKARSATALKHMVDERTKLKLEIEIDPMTVVLCTGGVFDEQQPTLVADLGKLNMITLDESANKDFEHLFEPKLRSLAIKAYDNFQLSLSNLQLIFADNFASCMNARDKQNSDHLLKPTGMKINVLRSTIDDMQLPLIRLIGELPDVVLNLSDDRIVKLLTLLNSIPRPAFVEEAVDLSAPVADGINLRDRAKMKMIMEVDELSEEQLHKEEEEREKREKSEEKKDLVLRERQIQLELNLILNEVGVVVNRGNTPFLSAHIRRLGLHMQKRMFDMVAQTHLGSLTVEMPQISSTAHEGASTLFLIDNETLEGEHLIDITYKQATDESPTFKTEFNSNEQSVYLVFQILNFNLHKEALVDLNNFNARLQRKMAKIPPPAIDTLPSLQALTKKKHTSSQNSLRSMESHQSTTKKPVQRKKTMIEQARMQQMAKKLKRFVFEFKMHEIAARLYARQGDIAGGIDPDAREDEVLEFCAMNIKELCLNGRMVEDGSMNCEIGLTSFTMDDRRKNAKLARLMDKKETKSTDKLVSMRYTQNAGGDKFVDILSSKFFLMLAPEFLGVLSAFFVLPPDDSGEEEDGQENSFVAPVTSKQTSSPVQSGSQLRLAAQSSSSSVVAKEQQTTASNGTLTLSCKIYEIEVILIEDSLHPNESQAIILSFNAIVDTKNVDNVQQMKGGIQNLQMFSTYFAPEKRHLSNYPILKQLDIMFTGSINAEEHSQHFAVEMDEVAIRVSPAVIRLLSAVSAQYSEHQKKNGMDGKQSKSVLKEYPDFWRPKQIEREKFWWFSAAAKPAIENDIETAEDAQVAQELQRGAERAEFSIRRFVATVEAGVKNVTRPMILLEMTMSGWAENWSSQLVAESEMRLQMSYYNENYNVWEPVIEPVLHEHEGWQSWALALRIGPQNESAKKVEEPSTSKKKTVKVEEEQQRHVPPPKMAIYVEAKELMNITVTKSFLQLLSQLGESFEKAAKQISPPKSRKLPGTSAYLVHNDTGLPIKLGNTETLKTTAQNAQTMDCAEGEYVQMERVLNASASSNELAPGNWQTVQDRQQVQLQLLFPSLETERLVNIVRAEGQYIDLPKEADSGKKWALVVDTRLENARHLVTLKSLVTIVNHLEMPIDVQSCADERRQKCGTVAPGEANALNVPLQHLYTPNGEFVLRPTGEKHDWSTKFSWHEFDTNKRHAVRCDLTANPTKGFYIEIVVTEQKIRRGQSAEECVAYTVHLFSPVHFFNTLPIPVQVTVPIEREVNGGEGVDLTNIVAGLPFIFSVTIDGQVYKKRYIIPAVKKILETVCMESETSDKKMCLGISWSNEFLRTTFSLYAPYWMVNDTKKALTYLGHLPKTTDTPQAPKRSKLCCVKRIHEAFKLHIPHSPDSTSNPLILPLCEEDFTGKKKAKVKIADSDWSAEFPLDTVGSSGRITCKAPDGMREYEMTLDVQLSQSGLTKVVTISPFYLLQNDGKFAIEVREPNTKEWITVPPESVIGFWPVQKAKRKTLLARFPNTREESVQFPFTETFEGFCKIHNSLIGVYVIVSVSEDSSVVHLEYFVPGMAPAIVMNSTKYAIEYKQANDEEWQSLPPTQMIPFSWDDSLSERKLEWKSGEAANSDELLRNRDVSYLPSRTDSYHYCVSFLSGRQRILLFTDEEEVSFAAHEAFEIEQPNIQVELSLQGVGISLVNNLKSVEVLYMVISKPAHSDNGFWLQYRQTDHQTTLHVKLHHFQMDNQLPASVFPSLLAMVPQPKSVVKNAPKPFLECSFVMSKSEHSNVVQIKLLEALVQEFAVRVDRTLINEILDMFPKESIEAVYNREAFMKDIELTKSHLDRRAVQTRASQAKAYYERMHISPLMIHLSFSQGHVDDKDQESVGIEWEFLNLILKSVGVTLTEIQDVTFKLAFFQRDATFYSQAQLMGEIQTHYTRQFIKQVYVLVLGLDILGNPFGLVRDLQAGAVDFFYQPVMGAITGPSEFVEGITLGVSSMFSHSVGGVLGAASRITGTVGKGVAALTMDEDYQRKRIQSRQQPTNLGEGIFRGVRGAGQGLIDGVTGVVSKPVEGAKKEGIIGFGKGIGKGLIGAVTRPVSGVVDLVTTAADSVKTVITNVEETKPIRPPRVISSDKIIRPFVFEEAIGYKIFRETSRGQYAETDQYMTYGPISKHLVFIVTDKRIIESRQHELTGNWSADWCPVYAEIKKPTFVSPDGRFGVEIKLKEPKGGFSLFGQNKSTKGKLILFSTEAIAKRVYERSLAAWESSV